MTTLQTELSPVHQVLVIMRITLREARRRKMLWVGLGLGIAFVGLFATGFYFAHLDFSDHYQQASSGSYQVNVFANIFMTAALYVVNFLVVMVTALTTVGTVSAEIDSNTVHAIAAKPIHRWQIILGKWLGHALMVSAYTLILTLGVMVSVWIISGYSAPNIIGVVLTLILESLVVLSITMLSSTLFSTLAAGVLVFMLYGLAFVGGWVEQFGMLFESQTAVDIGIASSLLLPSEALWRFAATLMQDATVAGLTLSPFSVISRPSNAFLVYSTVYVAGLLAAAIWVFRQRDF